MKKIILMVCCFLGCIIACTGIIFGIFLLGDHISGLHTVDIKPFREKYAKYADTIDAYDERITVYGTSGDYAEGSCWQCYNFDLDGLCYNFLFECNIYGNENMIIELSKVTSEMPNRDDLAIFITICQEFSGKEFSEALLREKCGDALRVGTGRLSKEYYFEVDEYGTLSFYGRPK